MAVGERERDQHSLKEESLAGGVSVLGMSVGMGLFRTLKQQ